MNSFRVRNLIACTALVLVGSSALLPTHGHAQVPDVPTPEEYFGFQMGTDNKLARWDKIVEYYQLLGEASDRLEVVNMGPTTLGNPFLALYFTSAENHAQLESLKRMNATLSDPRGATEAQIEGAIANGKAVVVQSLCLHSTEVAAGQTAVELAYDMVSRADDEIELIMDNTVGIMIPCFNPDGQIMVADWVAETTGTEYEGSSLPFLYHHFIGHDNNRDAFMTNTIESAYGAEIMFREWVPQAYVDHHQMGGYTARIYLPPYAEPTRPKADPIVWREMSWFGAHMAYKMEEAGLEGSVNAAIYSGWGHFGFHWITPFHNIAGMLTESASARMAAPLYVHPDQLVGSRQLPEYEEQTTFPNPWKGGWWRVRDIVERQKIAFMATLDIAARNRKTVLRNAYLKAKRQTERGAEGETVAFVIPAEQHDGMTRDHMINKLLGQGIEVQQATADFTHDGRVYGAGTMVVSMEQPKMGLIRWLLGETHYPDNSYTRDGEGNPIRPYDMTTDNISEFFGVRVDPTGTAVTTNLRVVQGLLARQGEVVSGSFGYAVDGRQNAAFKAVNLLWNEGASVTRATSSGAGLQTGDFVIDAGTSAELLTEVATVTGVDFRGLSVDPSSVVNPLERMRVGMYQRYLGGNMDEGWTRWILEDFEFPYTSLMDEELLKGNLNRNYDVIILPDDNVSSMTGEGNTRSDAYPPEYRSGFGQAGVDALEAFVKAGGTLVTFARAGDLAIEKFDLPIRNSLAGIPARDFWSPGATLKVKVDNTNPYAYGMPDRALAVFLQGNHAYTVTRGALSKDVHRIVEFVERDILHSGWLLGEENISNKATVVSVDHGQGSVLLIGFRAQHRAQAHGTFKLVFNALVSGHARGGAMAVDGSGSP